MDKPKRITDQLRQHIAQSGRTQYSICRDIGLRNKKGEVAQGNFSKFMSCRQGISLETVDKVCWLLNLELTKRK